MHQDGLGLVIGSVSNCNGLGRMVARGGKQEAVAQQASSFFKRKPMLPGISVHIGGGGYEGQI